MTQCAAVVDYILRFGSITPMDAFNDLGITKLATRISELQKAGIRFTKTWETSKNRFGKEVRYMRYSLDEGAMTQDGWKKVLLA